MGFQIDIQNGGECLIKKKNTQIIVYKSSLHIVKELRVFIPGKVAFTVRMAWWASPTNFVVINPRAPLHGKVLSAVLEFVISAGIV